MYIINIIYSICIVCMSFIIGFLETEVDLLDLEVILNLLPASDIQDLSKSMHIMNKNEGRTKKQLMHSLIKHSTKQRSLFAQNGDKIAKAILKK